MNLILHHFRKDLRSQRILLGVWFFLVLLQFAIAVWTPRPGDLLMLGLYSGASMFLPLLSSLILVVLVPQLVLQEPLVGTSAFWMTRPLSRGELLQAKGFFVLLLLLLPLLAQSAVLLANGADLREIALGGAEKLMADLSWIVLLMALAVFTASFGRFAIVIAVYLLATGAVAAGLYWFRLFHDPEWALNSMSKLSLTYSQGVVDSLLTIALGSGVVVHQYLTRNTRRSLALGVAAYLLTLVSFHLWPWDFLKPAPLAKTSLDLAPVQLALAGSVHSYDEASIRGGQPRKAISGGLVPEGVPPGDVVRFRRIDATLSRPGGGAEKIHPGMIADFQQANDGEAIERALGAIVLNPKGANFTSLTLFSIEANDYDRDAAVPFEFSAQVDLEVAHWVPQPDIPLRKGARLDLGPERVTLTDVLRQPDGIDLMGTERKIHLLLDRTRPPEDKIPGLGPKRALYVLLNRRLGEAFLQREVPGSVDFLSAAPGILSNHPFRLSFGPEKDRGMNVQEPITPEWLADAVLVRLDLVPLATITRPVTVHGFRMDGQFVLPPIPRKVEKADPAALAAIVLPDNPDDSQIRSYLAAIFVASRWQSIWSSADPQVAMIEKIGPGHMDILVGQLASAGGGATIYLRKAIEDLAQPADKEVILAALPANKNLIRVVNRYGWQKDAHDLIVSVINNPTDYPGLNSDSDWFLAAAALQDPVTYDALRVRFIQGLDRKFLYPAIRDLPDFDLAGTVAEAWKKAQALGGAEMGEMLPIAAELGEPDVLDVAEQVLRKGTDGAQKAIARGVFTDFTPAPSGSDEEILAWYEGHRGQLKFDPAAKKFVLAAAVGG